MKVKTRNKNLKINKLIKNNNFRNNQNYIISKDNINKLLTMVEYKDKYRNKNYYIFSRKESNLIIEYPYLTDIF